MLEGLVERDTGVGHFPVYCQVGEKVMEKLKPRGGRGGRRHTGWSPWAWQARPPGSGWPALGDLCSPGLVWPAALLASGEWRRRAGRSTPVRLPTQGHLYRNFPPASSNKGRPSPGASRDSQLCRAPMWDNEFSLHRVPAQDPRLSRSCSCCPGPPRPLRSTCGGSGTHRYVGTNT